MSCLKDWSVFHNAKIFAPAGLEFTNVEIIIWENLNFEIKFPSHILLILIKSLNLFSDRTEIEFRIEL